MTLLAAALAWLASAECEEMRRELENAEQRVAVIEQALQRLHVPEAEIPPQDVAFWLAAQGKADVPNSVKLWLATRGPQMLMPPARSEAVEARAAAAPAPGAKTAGTKCSAEPDPAAAEWSEKFGKRLGPMAFRWSREDGVFRVESGSVERPCDAVEPYEVCADHASEACDVMVISPGRRTCAAFCENRGLRCLNAWDESGDAGRCPADHNLELGCDANRLTQVCRCALAS